MPLFLIAQIAGRGVAIDTQQVDSVVDLGDIVAVPQAPHAVRGLAALRSRVVTVIDTGTALGVSPTVTSAKRAIITKIDGYHYAILVDALEDVTLLEHLPLSSGVTLDRGWAAVGTGIVERDDGPLLVVDLANLIPTLAMAA